MKKQFRGLRARALLLQASTLLLVACGGGGGGGSVESGPAGDVLSGAVVLDASNYVKTATIALAASDSSVFTPLEVLTGAQQQARDLMLRVAVAKALEFARKPPLLETLTGVTETTVEPCSGGGNISITATIASTSTITVGDRVALTFNACREPGSLINGAMEATFNAVTGNPTVAPPFSWTLLVSLKGLAVTGDSESASASGDISLALTASSSTTGQQVLSAPNLTISTVIGAMSSSEALSGFSLTQENLSNGDRFTVSGRITASDLGNKYFDMRTSTPFFSPSGASYPTSGVLEITGASGSKVRLSALAGGNALIELDANGDGTYETSTVKSWDSL